MPAYDYRCLECNELTEVVHPMNEKRRPVCQYCGGRTHKIITTFPHVKFDWNDFQSRDNNMRMVLHGAKSGRSSPASEQADGRT